MKNFIKYILIVASNIMLWKMCIVMFDGDVTFPIIISFFSILYICDKIFNIIKTYWQLQKTML